MNYKISKKATPKTLRQCEGGPRHGEILALTLASTLPLTFQVGNVKVNGRYVGDHSLLHWKQESQSMVGEQ